ncbi:Fe-S oxidoreductase [Leucobacter chromiireducens]|uniref:Fe-S oxidoreductase n=1 Tax=Leucobacter chromiireducens TaxID=283877 RepID=UPI000F642AF4|nr:Fe-S oxidoreductase [Leucobacter chromiireducens]
MQLGARWRVGEPPHRGVPPELHDAIAAAEAAHPGSASWTLTWLEGRPRCALDELLVVTLDAGGSVRAESLASDPDEEDDWLS